MPPTIPLRSPRKKAKPWKPTSAGAVTLNDAVHAQGISGPHSVAMLERIPLQNPRRHDPHGIMLGLTFPGSGCIVSNYSANRRWRGTSSGMSQRSSFASFDHCPRTNGGQGLIPQPIHCSRHTSHRSCRLNPFGESGRTSFTRFVQLSPSRAQTVPSCNRCKF